MKLVSSYDLISEHQERALALSSIETALADAKRAQESLSNAIRGIALLVEDAYGLEDLEQAENELRVALVKLEQVKTVVNYARVLKVEAMQ